MGGVNGIIRVSEYNEWGVGSWSGELGLGGRAEIAGGCPGGRCPLPEHSQNSFPLYHGKGRDSVCSPGPHLPPTLDPLNPSFPINFFRPLPPLLSKIIIIILFRGRGVTEPSIRQAWLGSVLKE